jgi:hypothetical protein
MERCTEKEGRQWVRKISKLTLNYREFQNLVDDLEEAI